MVPPRTNPEFHTSSTHLVSRGDNPGHNNRVPERDRGHEVPNRSRRVSQIRPAIVVQAPVACLSNRPAVGSQWSGAEERFKAGTLGAPRKIAELKVIEPVLGLHHTGVAHQARRIRSMPYSAPYPNPVGRSIWVAATSSALEFSGAAFIAVHWRTTAMASASMSNPAPNTAATVVRAGGLDGKYDR